MKMSLKKEERIEIRVSVEDKEVFKKAQELSGDRTFSGFIIRILRMQAERIISERDKIIASDRDRKIFFDTVFGDQEPNEKLVAAAKRYKSRFTAK